MAKKKKKNKVYSPYLIGVIFLLIIIGIIGYFVILRGQQQKQGIDMVEEVAVEAVTITDTEVLERLGEIFALPEEVTPIMAIVSDAEEVKQRQPAFFKNAQNGQRLIVYPNITILYDYDANKIINAGNINILSGADKNALGNVQFTIYNGSGAVGAASSFEKKLRAAFNNVDVTLENANGQYDETLVIDLIGTNPEMERIANALGATISELPDNEEAPDDAMVLIIVGADYEPDQE